MEKIDVHRGSIDDVFDVLDKHERREDLYILMYKNFVKWLIKSSQVFVLTLDHEDIRIVMKPSERIRMMERFKENFIKMELYEMLADIDDVIDILERVRREHER